MQKVSIVMNNKNGKGIVRDLARPEIAFSQTLMTMTKNSIRHSLAICRSPVEVFDRNLLEYFPLSEIWLSLLFSPTFLLSRMIGPLTQPPWQRLKKGKCTMRPNSRYLICTNVYSIKYIYIQKLKNTTFRRW